jgi:hypothetical protein
MWKKLLTAIAVIGVLGVGGYACQPTEVVSETLTTYCALPSDSGARSLIRGQLIRLAQRLVEKENVALHLLGQKILDSINDDTFCENVVPDLIKQLEKYGQ